MFDAEKFLKDYDIPIPDINKNCQKGWVNITCPFCDDVSNHGGFNMEKGYYNCWKCGWHPLIEVIKNLLNISFQNANEILKEYSISYFQQKESRKEKITFSFPKGTNKIKQIHYAYLEKRNFDPVEIEKLWKIQGTNYYGNYKYRIIAPIIFENEIVSYQGRDITDKQYLRYKACPLNQEIIQHKHIVYGLDYIQNEQAIIVEGITDVWRLGKGSICCFGTGYTKSQLYLLSNYLKKAFILFDNEFTAQKKAEKLAIELSLLHIETEIIRISGVKDPAELSQKDAGYLRKNLIRY